MGSPVAPVKRGARGRPTSAGRMQAQLADRLAARRGEIEAAAATRIYAISDPAEIDDPTYLEGLRAALVAAVDYGLAAVELGEERCPPPPPALLVQARMAARAGVGLDTVLRRYFAGYALLGDFLLAEAEQAELIDCPAFKILLRSQAALFDRLLAVVSEEHRREAKRHKGDSGRRRADRIERLIAGEPLDVSRFDYDFDAHHLGGIAKGAAASQAIHALADAADRRVMAVEQSKDTVWFWLGGRRGIDCGRLDDYVASSWPSQVCLGLGEPAHGLAGWRLTHRQAKATLPIALQSPGRIARYADVALLTTVVRDELLSTSLWRLYLAPLEAEKDKGEALRHTLRAYFAAGRNTSSAAAASGISRQAAAKRLHTAEERVGRPLVSCGNELEIALRLEALGMAGGKPQPLNTF